MNKRTSARGTHVRRTRVRSTNSLQVESGARGVESVAEPVVESVAEPKGATTQRRSLRGVVAALLVTLVATEALAPLAAKLYQQSDWGGYYAREAFPPNERHEGRRMIAAIGDSLLAGSGSNVGMFRGTVRDDEDGGCRQSTHSPAYFAGQEADADVLLFACSGVGSDGVIRDQLPHVPHDVDYVLVSMGANNHGFEILGAISGCIVLKFQMGESCIPRIESAQRSAAGVLRDVVDGLRRIRQISPSASVVFVYYPDSLPREMSRICGMFSEDELRAARLAQDNMREMFRTAVEQAGVHFFDPSMYFSPEQHPCGPRSVFRDVSLANVYRWWLPYGNAKGFWLHLTSDGNWLLGNDLGRFLRTLQPGIAPHNGPDLLMHTPMQ